MKKSKYSNSRIVSNPEEAVAGQPVKEICRKYGIMLVRSARLCRLPEPAIQTSRVRIRLIINNREKGPQGPLFSIVGGKGGIRNLSC